MTGEVAVYENENRSESLAFLFFKDGVREITFLPGIEGDEMERFLDVLQRARDLKPDADDLLTVLWEANLTPQRTWRISEIPQRPGRKPVSSQARQWSAQSSDFLVLSILNC